MRLVSLRGHFRGNVKFVAVLPTATGAVTVPEACPMASPHLQASASPRDTHFRISHGIIKRSSFVGSVNCTRPVTSMR